MSLLYLNTYNFSASIQQIVFSISLSITSLIYDICIWQVQVRVCSGKPTRIIASRKGFYPAGKHILVSHALVALLQQISRVFEAVSLNSF